jgi:hypothetical protein
MATASTNPEKANHDEGFERIVLHFGVYFRGVHYNSDELMKLKQTRLLLRVVVRLDKPDASAILVRVPRRKSFLSVPEVSPRALRTSKENCT